MPVQKMSPKVRVPGGGVAYRGEREQTMAEPGDDLWDAYLETKRDALTVVMRRTFEACHDAPVHEVMVVLHRELERIGLHASDAWLLPHAKIISMGQQVVFK